MVVRFVVVVGVVVVRLVVVVVVGKVVVTGYGVFGVCGTVLNSMMSTLGVVVTRLVTLGVVAIGVSGKKCQITQYLKWTCSFCYISSF